MHGSTKANMQFKTKTFDKKALPKMIYPPSTGLPVLGGLPYEIQLCV